jgi:hypothetical protein
MANRTDIFVASISGALSAPKLAVLILKTTTKTTG